MVSIINYWNNLRSNMIDASTAILKATCLSKSCALAPDEVTGLMSSLLGEVLWPVLCRRSIRMTIMACLSLAFYKYVKTQQLISLSCQSHSQILPFTCHFHLIYLFTRIFFFFSSVAIFLGTSLYRMVISCDANANVSMETLSTTEYTRAIFEPFVHLINYVFVLKAAWLDCLIMY